VKSPFLKTAIAFVLLLGLGGVVYWLEHKRKGKPEGGKEKEKVFALADAKTKVKELTLAPAGEPAVHLVKTAEGWRMMAPLSVPADASEVDTLVSSLESLEIDEVVGESLPDLTPFGLSAPRNTVSVLLEGATEPLKLQLGDKTPDGSAVYAKLPSQPRVFTLAQYVAGSFDKKPFDLRDRALVKFKREDLKTLEVTGPEGAYALARDEQGEWNVVRPLKTRAGRWSVDGLAGMLESLRMESVASEDARDLRPYSLDKPLRTVALGLADGSTRRLEIGSSPSEKKHHAREAASRLVAIIPEALVLDLAKGLKELRAKRLLEVAAYEVEGFEVEAEGVKKTYARSSVKDKEGVDIYHWKRTAPNGAELETNKVQDALFQVGGVEVQEFFDQVASPAAYGLEAPVLKLTLNYGANKPPAWFELSRKDGAFYARRSDDEAVLKLDGPKAEELLKSFKEL